MMYGWGPMVGWGAGLMVLQALAIWALVLVIGAAVWRRAADTAPRAGARTSPDEVLADRLARGEIDEEEYRRRRAVLAEREPAPR